jgi:hypothetical protein
MIILSQIRELYGATPLDEFLQLIQQPNVYVPFIVFASFYFIWQLLIGIFQKNTKTHQRVISMPNYKYSLMGIMMGAIGLALYIIFLWILQGGKI